MVVIYIFNFFNELYNIDVIDVLLKEGINWLVIEKLDLDNLFFEGKICVIIGMFSEMGCFDVKVCL